MVGRIQFGIRRRQFSILPSGPLLPVGVRQGTNRQLVCGYSVDCESALGAWWSRCLLLGPRDWLGTIRRAGGHSVRGRALSSESILSVIHAGRVCRHCGSGICICVYRKSLSQPAAQRCCRAGRCLWPLDSHALAARGYRFNRPADLFHLSPRFRKAFGNVRLFEFVYAAWLISERVVLDNHAL